MTINKFTILVAASREFQKVEIGMEVSDILLPDTNEFDMEGITAMENMCIYEAVKVLDETCRANNVQTKTPPVVRTQKYPQTSQNGYRGNPQQIQRKLPSEKQINLLRKIGYSDPQIQNMSSQDANQIIREYQMRTGYQAPSQNFQNNGYRYSQDGFNGYPED